MNRIIVPTDFSEIAWNATCHALEYSKLFNVELVLLHVFDHSYQDLRANPSEVTAKISRETRRMKQLVLRIKSLSNFGDIRLKTECQEGILINRINDMLTTNGENLVIMGTLGRNGTFARLFGSNTSRIMKGIECPLMVIPLNYTFSREASITVGVDYGSIIRKPDLLLLDKLNKMVSNSGIRLIHIISDFNDPYKLLPLNQFNQFKKSFKEIIGNNIPELLEKYTLQNKSGLLVLIKKNKSFYDKIMQRSVTESIAINAKTPLLILPQGISFSK